MGYRNGEHPHQAHIAGSGFFKPAFIPALLSSCQLPSVGQFLIGSLELVLLGPAQDEANRVRKRRSDPEAAGEAAVPHVDDTSAETLYDLAQQVQFDTS